MSTTIATGRRTANGPMERVLLMFGRAEAGGNTSFTTLGTAMIHGVKIAEESDRSQRRTTGANPRLAAWHLVCISLVYSGGCATPPRSPIPEAWPPHLAGRELYLSDHASIYSSSPTAAAWADRYLANTVRSVENRYGVAATRGLVLTIEPGDAPLAGVSAWPPSPEPRQLRQFSMPRQFDVSELGVPSLGVGHYGWVCALPTDKFIAGHVKSYHDWVLRYFHSRSLPYQLSSWPLLLMLPKQREAYTAKMQLRRERALVVSVLEGVDAPESTRRDLVAGAEELYKQKEAELEKQYGVMD